MSRGRILILCIYPPGKAPGQRFRFEQYIPALRDAGYEVDQIPFWDDATMSILYTPGHTTQKVRGVLSGFIRRARLFSKIGRYDHVYIHLEAAPIGPPVFERLLFALGKRVVYDIDDAIHIPKTSKVNRLASGLRWRSKVTMITRKSARVSVVNEFMRDWALQHRDEAVLIPTTIDTNYHRRSGARVALNTPVRLGWTGTHSTAYFLEIIRPALVALQKTHSFTFRVICDVDPGFPELQSYEFVRWTKANEIADLECIDIGVMPVTDEEFSRGKVGFKAIQYAALEIPAVASDVGSGRGVVVDGRTGYLVRNEIDEWVDRLRRMIDDPIQTLAMGKTAYEHIRGKYTVTAQTPNYLALFDEGTHVV